MYIRLTGARCLQCRGRPDETPLFAYILVHGKHAFLISFLIPFFAPSQNELFFLLRISKRTTDDYETRERVSSFIGDECNRFPRQFIRPLSPFNEWRSANYSYFHGYFIPFRSSYEGSWCDDALSRSFSSPGWWACKRKCHIYYRLKTGIQS